MKHKSLFKTLLAGAFLTGILASCSASGTECDPYAEIEMFPVVVKGDENFSLYKPDGTVICRNQLKSEPSPVSQGLFYMKTDEGLGLFKVVSDSKKLLYNDLVFAGAARDGLIPVARKSRRIEIMDLDGNVVSEIMPYVDKEAAYCYMHFTEEMLPVATEDNKWGYVDAAGYWVIAPKYFDVSYFSEGKALVAKKDNPDDVMTYAIIDTQGNEIYNFPEYFTLCDSMFDYGVVFCKDSKTNKVYKLTSDLKLIEMPDFVKYISFRSDKYIVYASDDVSKWGIINYDGAEILPAEYSTMHITALNQFLVNTPDGGNWKVLDHKGKTVTEFPQAVTAAAALGRFGIGIAEGELLSFLDSKTFKPINPDLELTKLVASYTADPKVYSQYFNWSNFARDMVGMIGVQSIGRYKLGSFASDAVSNPASLEKEPTVTFKDLSLSKRNYCAEVMGTFVPDNVSLFFLLMTGDIEYRLTLLTINFTVSSPICEETATALKEAFQNAGYTLVTATNDNSSDYAALYSNSNGTGVYVSYEQGEKEGMISVYQTTNTEYTTNLKNNIAKLKR